MTSTARGQSTPTTGTAAGSRATDVRCDQNVVVIAPVQGNVGITYGDVYKTVAEDRSDSTGLRQAYLYHFLGQTQTLQLTGPNHP